MSGEDARNPETEGSTPAIVMDTPPESLMERIVSWLGPVIVLGTAVFLIRGCVVGPGGAAFLRTQLVSVANAFLVPNLEVDGAYQDEGGTFVLQRLRLASDDVPVIEIHRAELEVASFSPRERALEVERLRLDRPILTLTQTQDGFMGLMPLLRGASEDATPEPAAGAQKTPTKRSDRFEVRHVEIRKGRLILNLLGAPEIVVDDIDLETTFDPEARGIDGWYNIEFDIGRGTALSGAFVGRVNIDTGVLQVIRVDVTIEAGPEQIDELPELFRELALEYGLSGSFRVEGRGEVPLASPRDSSLLLDITARDAGFVWKGVNAPVEQAVVRVSYQGGLLEATQVLAQVAGGRVWGTVRLDPNGDELGLEARVGAEDLDLEVLTPGSSVRGIVGVQAEGVLLPTTARSVSVEAEVTKGDLVALPVISQISAIVSETPLPTLKRRHAARLVAHLGPDGAIIDGTRFSTNVIAGAVEGSIMNDLSLDLRVKAGPLQKAKDMLGVFSLPLDAVLAVSRSYIVRGDLTEPKVSIFDRDGPEG